MLNVNLDKENIKELSFEFDGTGFILAGGTDKRSDKDPDYIIEAVMYIDGKKSETAKFPSSFTTRRHELFWKYELPKGKHKVDIKVLNPDERYMLNTRYYIVFSDKPAENLELQASK